MNRDASARVIPAVLASVAAGALLVIASGGTLLRIGLLATMVLLLATLSVPSLQRVLLAVAILEIPLQLDVYLNNDAARENAISGINLSVTTVVLVALYSLWAAELAGRTARISRRATRAALPAITYVCLVVASVLVAGDVMLAASEVVILVQALALLLYLLHYVRGRDDIVFVFAALMAGLIIQSLIVLGMYLSGSELAIGPVTAEFEAGRVAGTFKSPNILGGYLALLLPLTLGLMLSSAPVRHRVLGAVAFGLGSVALVLSYSRGAWVGLAVALTWLVATAWRRRWLTGIVPLLAAVVVVGVVAVFLDEIVLRVADYNDQAARSRLPLMELAFSMIRDHPLFGVGANNFAATLDQYVTVDYSREWIAAVHNKYLLVWAETGLFGLLAFSWMLVSAVRTGWRQVAAGDRLLAPLGLGLAAGVVANMVHMAVDRFHFRPQVQLLWLMIGLILALPGIARRQPVPRPRRVPRSAEVGG